MKCLTDKQIQQLIDGELSADQLEKYNSHIYACPYCHEKYNEQKELAISIKSLINETANSPERIPDFRVPTKRVNLERKARRIPLWVKLAAVLIPVFFVWKFVQKPQEDFKPTAESIQMYEMSNGIDANTAFQENMIVTTVTDDKGNVIECSTN
jgi:hypothetical protein